MKTNLEVVETPCGDTMYFVRGKEVSEPLLLPTPVTAADDTQVVAFSEGGLRPMCFFTQADVKGLSLKTAVNVPDQLFEFLK